MNNQDNGMVKIMIIVLDSNDNIIEFLDENNVSVEIDDVYMGYKSLKLTYKLSDVQKDKFLFRQGNKIYTEETLFIINAEVEFDYIKQMITVEAEEVLVELNNCEPFYINDKSFANSVKGTNITLSKQFLNRLLAGFYIVDKTDLDEIREELRIIQVNGTITRYSLLKLIESTTGLVFKRYYVLENNKVIRKISLLNTQHYGVTHDKVLESITFGENTNKLSYSSDETNNARGIMPIVSAENSDNVDYTKILKRFYNLDINHANANPNITRHTFTKTELINSSKQVMAILKYQGYLPEKICVNNVELGVGQFLHLLSQSIAENSSKMTLELIYTPKYSSDSNINAVFTVDEIIALAKIVNKYCESNGETPAFLSTRHGRLSYQLLTYIFVNYIAYNNPVVLKTLDLPLISRIKHDFVNENIDYITEYTNFEYMPFLYTQNTSESSSIPYNESLTQLSGEKTYDITKYISESYPIIIVQKTAGVNEIYVKVTSKCIADDNPTVFGVYFKDIGLIQDNSNIEIDFNKRTIKYMKYFETVEEKTVTETVTTQNTDVITVNHMPSCSHCSGTAYKRYNKTWKNYCPLCKSSGTLRDNPKKVYEGEITCSKCDADYCGYCGYEKLKNARGNLTPASATSTQNKTTTVPEVKSEYKEVTASEDTTDITDTKVLLSDIITPESRLDAWYGDVSFSLKGCTLVSLNCESTKIYELAPFPYIKLRNTQYIYAQIEKLNFNYINVTNNKPKLESFETSEQSVEEVLIGCWKKLNGSEENTKWLEKNENIEIDLVETGDIKYETGDFVFIKLPDTTIFKAQITETSFNPKLTGEKKVKIGNVVRESV